MFQLYDQHERIDAWLDAHSDEERRTFLQWLPKLLEDPQGVATAQSSTRGTPIRTVMVPGLSVFVDYAVFVDHFTVVILGVSSLGLDDIS